MKADRLDRLLALTRRLRGGFALTAPEPWTPSTAAAEATVQLGHLALCLLRHGAADTSALQDAQRPIDDIGDELADVLLALLSTATLAGTAPVADPRPVQVLDQGPALLLLLVATGQLAEAALVHDRLRHLPTGTPPSIPEACSAAVTAAETLAQALGLDLPDEFESMAEDAGKFLRSRGIG
ncbi:MULTISPECIES: hypothetical protein [Actinosynnema]|uniref:hypothetical protein n=1 Tax=Actinosynnema TaxID=40566 RepID=UPI0020A23FDE|nr:hypothetical protein [Actinosynnema pretiosum]MCP2094723.1 hypothetical protein [Actinosynnema pretiosum]